MTQFILPSTSHSLVKCKSLFLKCLDAVGDVLLQVVVEETVVVEMIALRTKQGGSITFLALLNRQGENEAGTGTCEALVEDDIAAQATGYAAGNGKPYSIAVEILVEFHVRLEDALCISGLNA